VVGYGVDKHGNHALHTGTTLAAFRLEKEPYNSSRRWWNCEKSLYPSVQSDLGELP